MNAYKKTREALVLALSLLDLKERVPYKTVSQKDLDFMKDALAAPPRNCDRFVDEKQADMLHEAFIKYCNRCDCPMGCDYRNNPRFLLDTNCASIMKCFARFALSRATPAKGGEG